MHIGTASIDDQAHGHIRGSPFTLEEIAQLTEVGSVHEYSALIIAATAGAARIVPGDICYRKAIALLGARNATLQGGVRPPGESASRSTNMQGQPAAAQ